MNIIIEQPGEVDVVIAVGEIWPGTGDATAFEFAQDIPAGSWTVSHGLGIHPSVTVVDSTNKMVIAGIEYLDLNTIVVTFSTPMSGKVFCS